MKTHHKTFQALTLAAALLLGACANQLEPAQRAIAGIDSAIKTAAPDAARYVPDELAAVQAKVADLKASFDKKDYKTVLATAPAVLKEAQGLLATAALKKEELLKAMSSEWSSLAASLPQLVGSVKARVDALSRMRKLPAGVDLKAGKAGLGEATALWVKAQSAFSAGNMEEAVTTAREVQAKAQAAATALKI